MTPRARTKRNTGRQALLDTTLRLIGERGIPGLTMRTIAEEAGLSLGLTTYHFRDRDALLREALTQFTSDEVARCDLVLESLHHSQADGDQILDALVGELERSFAQPVSMFAQLELFLAASRDAELAEVAKDCIRAYERLVSHALRAAGIREDRIPSCARWIVALADGYALHSAASDSRTLLPADFSDAVRTLVGRRNLTSVARSS